MAMRRPRTNSRLTSKGGQLQRQGSGDREEDGDRGGGGKPRKRKLSDMLGHPWSKEDLELFYEAFSKHGKDWKKVAGSTPRRTVEMVEALYVVNKAYLSLPPAMSSAAGLIAMMTDHYNILDQSEEESSEDLGTGDRSHQMQSRSRTRAAAVVGRISAPLSHAGSLTAKKPRTVAGSRSGVVGKRTPRYPSGNAAEQKGKAKVTGNRVQTEEYSDDESEPGKEAEVVALALVTASQQGSSPLMPRTTPRRKASRTSLQNGLVKECSLKAESGGRDAKSTSGEDGPDSSPEKPMQASISMILDKIEAIDGSGGRFSDGKGRSKRPPAKKLKAQKQELKHEDSNEWSSQTGIADDGGDDDYEDPGEEEDRRSTPQKKHSSQKTKKRSRQLFSGDRSSGLDALATLADLSLNGLLPPSRPCSDSEKEEEENHSRPVVVTQVPKAPTEKNIRDGEKKEGNSRAKEDERSNEQTEKGDGRPASGSKQSSTSPPDSRKRKRKSHLEKTASQGKVGADEPSHNQAEPQVTTPKVETPIVLKPRRKPKRLTSAKTVSKQGLKPNKNGDASGLDLELSVRGTGQASNDETLPLKLRSKKKCIAEKGAVNGFEDRSGDTAQAVKEASFCPHASAELGPFDARARLIHCLKTPKLRQWCTYEWFYSAIDLPWFANNEFVEYLHHAGLGHVPRLTRVEWGVIRCSLGKPRRLSRSFLREERAKLEKYREEVRDQYHELRTGLREGLPSDLARPLTVGQRVIAKHPRTRQIHDGSILTVDRSRCRVQFDRPELGVEFVLDIDAMPVHQIENMPEMMRRKRTILDAVDRSREDSKHDVKLQIGAGPGDKGGAGGAARAALNERLERPVSASHLAAFLTSLNKTAQENTVEAVRRAKTAARDTVAANQQGLMSQHSMPGQAQVSDDDARALAELSAALNKKEPLVVELQRLNDEVPLSSDALKRQHSLLNQQIKDLNEEVSEAMSRLLRRAQPSYVGGVLPWQGGFIPAVNPSAGNGGGPSEANLPGSFEAGLVDVALSSRKHAQRMVSAAVQCLSDLKDGEDPMAKIGGALDLIPRGGMPPTQGITAPCATCTTEGGVRGARDAALSCEPPQPPAAQANGETDDAGELPRSHSGGGRADPQIKAAEGLDCFNHVSRGEGKEGKGLSELMTSCVATLLMVQTLTEKQFPAPEVALTLDNALESLRPQAAQNHCIFKDIEQQFGLIKAQILAQIPIQSNVPFAVDTTFTQPNPT